MKQPHYTHDTTIQICIFSKMNAKDVKIILENGTVM